MFSLLLFPSLLELPIITKHIKDLLTQGQLRNNDYSCIVSKILLSWLGRMYCEICCLPQENLEEFLSVNKQV